MPFTKNPHPLPPNKAALAANDYSGAYLLGLHFSVPRSEFEQVTAKKDNRAKLYFWRGRVYVAPHTKVEPPAGYDWQHIGRRYGRDLYVADRLV